MESPRAVALLLAAGSGSRLGSEIPKAFVEIAGRSLVDWCVQSLRDSGVVSELLVALPEGQKAPQGTVGVDGGAERSLSVRAALAAAPASEYVIVHDAARPLAPPELFQQVLTDLTSSGGDCVLAAKPVTDTIKRVDSDGAVIDTPDRREYWAAETPQAFRRDALERALSQSADELAAATDDASLVETLGGEVTVSHWPEPNFKITHGADLDRAAVLLMSRR